MRIQKHRAWIGDAPMKHRIEDKMYYQNNEYLSSYLRRIYDCYGVTHPSYLSFELEERLMLYTGLKDKNGKEIYEGDIVGFVIPHETYKGYAVVFEEGSFVCYHTKLKDEYNKPSRWCTLQRGLEIADNKAFKGLIVIGNIYENPELLN
jgi:uncharacterized phage protein (TIGR01671 family)